MKKYHFFLVFLASVLAITLSTIEVLAQNTSKPLFIDKPNTLITNSKQLTFVGSRSGEGYFSADGKKMVYQSEREEGNPFYQIFLLDLASGKSSRISTGKGMTTCAWLHPNGKKAMWSSTHLDPKIAEKVKAEYTERAQPVKKRYSWNYDDQYDIFESDLSGKNIKRLTKELGYDAEGSYSPDGKWIAFASNRSFYTDELTAEEKKIAEQDPSYMMEIYIMKSDGSQVKRLTHARGYDGGPFFSADGKKITWRRFTPDGNRAEIYTMNVDGSEQQSVTRLNAMSWAPFYHPSGEYIIFGSSILGYANFELFIVDANGQGIPIRVTFADGFDGLPTFTPDGKKISWTHRNEKGESQIYLADWDHEQALKLVIENRPLNKSALHLSPEISADDTKQIVDYLASEELKGRMTGSEEERLYTDQIVNLFKQWGLVPVFGNSFIQSFEFTSSVIATENNSIEFKGRLEANLKRGEDYQVISYSRSGDFNAAPVVFAGYGIKAPATDKLTAFDSYKNLDVKDKWVILLDHLPIGSNKELNQHLLIYSRPQHKVTVAKNQQAAGVIFVTDVGLKNLKFEGSISENTLPVIKISTKAFNRLLSASDAKVKNYSQLEQSFSTGKLTEGFSLSSQYISAKIGLQQQRSTGRNIVGKILPAVKSKKTPKSVIIGAHGDHLGQGTGIDSSLATATDKSDIHYGADDNASGVSGILELAHYYSLDAQKKQLKKPVYFAVWSGEEIGVLGSAHFTKSWKKQTGRDFNQDFEASLNMDMIGRLRDKLQVQGTGSAKEWAGLSEEVALVTGVPLTLTSDPYLPTDAMSFYLAEIPSISFTTGSHEEYHTPRDTAQTINHSGLVRVIDVVRVFTSKLAHFNSQIVNYAHVSGNSGSGGGGSRNFRIYLGTIPDYSQEGVKGVKISGASKDSPAEKAGLKAGDVIIEFNNINIENLYDYVYALQSAKPDLAVTMGVVRQGKKLELNITPVLKE
ncbi:M28 family peptidase [Pseudobdellovibrio exovorus]|uniref:Component of the Tol biopolymer transport system n=1 Tax=Pseudobdellovibrio exovorus JSS TaxID=1184267 RepID=M4V8K2_9BACT|nr:M28 family peptidase [Pseudobdellovibrio exovorus]AGH95523.1 component of the Tol biopolymer transport system [Pseudobdellovibrio exovorus JSS]